MSGIAKSVKKVFKKTVDTAERVLKSDLAKTMVVAAGIYWGVGTAQAYFAAPEAGLGSAMSSSANSMWTSTSSFFSGGAPPGAVATPLDTSTMATGSGTALVDTAASQVGPTIGMEPMDLTVTGGGGASATTPLGGVGAPAVSAPAAQKGGGLIKWVQDNPMAAMMLGQAGVGAYQGYLQNEAEEREDDIRRRRGLMGFDEEGDYGIVNTAAFSSPAPKAVAPQAVARPGVRRFMRPVSREDLPKLNRQGLIMRGG